MTGEKLILYSSWKQKFLQQNQESSFFTLRGQI